MAVLVRLKGPLVCTALMPDWSRQTISTSDEKYAGKYMIVIMVPNITHPVSGRLIQDLDVKALEMYSELKTEVIFMSPFSERLVEMWCRGRFPVRNFPIVCGYNISMQQLQDRLQPFPRFVALFIIDGDGQIRKEEQKWQELQWSVDAVFQTISELKFFDQNGESSIPDYLLKD